MTASVPLHRVHVYVRRLVHLGHKVAVVRQVRMSEDLKGSAVLEMTSTCHPSDCTCLLTAWCCV